MNEIQSQNQSFLNTSIPSCKYCQSTHVIKFGTLKGVQRYFCRDCNHKFVSTDTIPKMQNSTKEIADVINMYYEGLSEPKIRRNRIQQEQNYISTGSVYNWVNRFTDLAIKEADKYHPKVGDTWIADETFIRIDKRKPSDPKVENPYDKSRSAKWIVFWDIIDADTRFLLASHVTSTRNKADANALMVKAAKRAGKLPKVVVTDKLKAYLDGIEIAYGTHTQHKQGAPFEIENNTNLIERFHSTLKNRMEVTRAMKNKTTLQKFTDGWLVHYNYFRPHMSLGDKTPAEEAGIKFPFKNWKDVVEQPYKNTSRIRIIESPTVKMPKPRVPRISSTVPRITPKPPKITNSVFKGGGMLSRHKFRGSSKVRDLGAGVIRSHGKQHLRLD
jgi:putative transposase